MLTKEDLHAVKMELYREIVICEKDIDGIKSHMSKVDTLYLKDDVGEILLESFRRLAHQLMAASVFAPLFRRPERFPKL